MRRGAPFAAIRAGQAMAAGGVRLGEVLLRQAVAAEQQVVPLRGQMPLKQPHLAVNVVPAPVEGGQHLQFHAVRQPLADGFDGGGAGGVRMLREQRNQQQFGAARLLQPLHRRGNARFAVAHGDQAGKAAPLPHRFAQ